MNKKEHDLIVVGYENFKHSEKCEGCDKCTNTAPPRYGPTRVNFPNLPIELPEPINTDCDTVASLEGDDTPWGSFSGGTKGDTGKTRLGLIPPEAIEQIGKAFTHGARKYGDYNYRKGINCSRLYDAAMRHLNAYWGGEDIDEDSSLPHLALAGSEICMLIAMGSKHDDRYERGE